MGLLPVREMSEMFVRCGLLLWTAMRSAKYMHLAPMRTVDRGSGRG